MKNAYKNDVLKAFDDANVDYGRVGAGSTGIHNACDRMLIFRDTKAAIRIAESKRVDYSNHLLERYLRNAMNNFKSLFPHVSFSPDFINKNIMGLSKLVYVFQKTMTPQKISEGFKV